MISLLLLTILLGGVFITLNLFQEVENSSKEYFIIISITILLIVSVELLSTSIHKGQVLGIQITVYSLRHSAHKHIQTEVAQNLNTINTGSAQNVDTLENSSSLRGMRKQVLHRHPSNGPQLQVCRK